MAASAAIHAGVAAALFGTFATRDVPTGSPPSAAISVAPVDVRRDVAQAAAPHADPTAYLAPETLALGGGNVAMLVAGERMRLSLAPMQARAAGGSRVMAMDAVTDPLAASALRAESLAATPPSSEGTARRAPLFVPPTQVEARAENMPRAGAALIEADTIASLEPQHLAVSGGAPEVLAARPQVPSSPPFQPTSAAASTPSPRAQCRPTAPP